MSLQDQTTTSLLRQFDILKAQHADMVARFRASADLYERVILADECDEIFQQSHIVMREMMRRSSQR